MDIQEHVPLAPRTTFKIGGRARYLARVTNVQEVQEALAFAKEKSLKVFFLGGGSNVLFDDAGFDGLVVSVDIRGLTKGAGVWVVGAGEPWDAVVEHATEDGMWGLENLSGIPGTVGGAVVQNIGAYGAALSQTLEWVEVYDTHTGRELCFSNAECVFGYRDSIFKREPGRFVVVRAAFKLSAVGKPNVSYKDLASHFGEHIPTVAEVRGAVCAIRKNKFPDLAIEGSAGSFFKNPVLPAAEAARLQAEYPHMPLFSLPESDGVKIPLGWFLDYRHNVLDMRQLAVGGARMFEKQFLVIATRAHTSSRDVQELARAVQDKVRATLRIEIEPEVCIVS